jgi:hypothetical protein
MGRLVTTDSTGTQRARLRRTIAEALKRLMAKGDLDDEARDLAALIVYVLREIAEGVEKSASAWDKRHYYIKADRLRADWDWADRFADRLANLLVVEDWGRVPLALAQLAPRFADVNVVKLTRSSALWNGAYDRLVQETRAARRAAAADAGESATS